MTTSIWDKKYAPSKLDDLVCTERVRKKLRTLIDKKDVGVMRLFYGSPGHGKTAATRVLIKEIGAQFKEVNTPDDNGVGFIRDIITPFAKTKSINKLKKIVFLDEADRMSIQAMDILKPLSQNVIDNCSFILNTNHIERFPEANLSRVDKIFMLPRDDKEIIELKKAFFMRAKYILDQENVKFDVKVLQKHIIKNYPDFRKTIIMLQETFETYGEINENILEYRVGLNNQLIDALKNKISNKEMIELSNDLDPIDFYFSFHDKIKNYLIDSSILKAYEIYSFYNSYNNPTSKAAHLACCLLELLRDVKLGKIQFKDIDNEG